MTKAEGSRREMAKADRRENIVRATYDLLREGGVDNVSVKEIARRAGVSAATVYNLFGAKRAVLSRLFDLHLMEFENTVSRLPSLNSLERIFDAVRIAAKLYASDPAYYRATMLLSGGKPEKDEIYSTLRGPRLRFWHEMIEAARKEGHLRADANVAILSVLFMQIARGALIDWIAKSISVNQLEYETKLGFACALYPFAKRNAMRKLRELIDKFDQELAQIEDGVDVPESEIHQVGSEINVAANSGSYIHGSSR